MANDRSFDAAHQIIVAYRLVTAAADASALVPLVDDVRAHLGRKPREVSGDAGFADEANLRGGSVCLNIV